MGQGDGVTSPAAADRRRARNRAWYHEKSKDPVFRSAKAEKDRARAAKRRALETPEQRTARLARLKELRKERRDRESPEARDARLERGRESTRFYRESMAPERRLAFLEKDRARSRVKWARRLEKEAADPSLREARLVKNRRAGRAYKTRLRERAESRLREMEDKGLVRTVEPTPEEKRRYEEAIR